jgi:methionyl-tRNA formyltransferase
LTIHQVDQRIDTGPILHQVRYPIEFRPTIEETVRASLAVCRQLVPPAVRYACENYDALRAKAALQTGGRVFTTPSYWQFRKMVKNHAGLYEASLKNANAGNT